MKRKPFYILFFLIFLCACTAKVKEIASASDPEYLAFWWPKLDSIDHKLVMTADPVWQFGRNGEDIYDWNYQQKWYDGCHKALICTYDSLHPSDTYVADKDLRMLDELSEFFKKDSDYSTMGMIIATDLEENFVMYKVVNQTKSIIDLADMDSRKLFSQEIEAWNELHRLLNKFCLGITYLGWYRGSGAGPACTAMACDITNTRLGDVERLAKFYNQELPYSQLLYTSTLKNELERAVESAIEKRTLTKDMDHGYTNDEFEGYEREYNETVAYKDSLIDAYHNWLSVRETLLGFNNNTAKKDTMIALVSKLVYDSGED